MEKGFIKEIKITDTEGTNSYEQLLKNIESAKQILENDYKNMQFVEDKDLIDYYTYKIKSEQAKYDFLIREAKKLESGMYL